MSALVDIKAEIKEEIVTEFYCAICNSFFDQESELQRHFENHESNNFESPEVQEQNEGTEETLEIKEETFFVEYNCQYCYQNFELECDYKSHLETHEKGIIDIQNTEVDLHSTFKNPEPNKPYTCQKCEKSFSSVTGLRNHQLVHSNKRPHACRFCDKNFKTKADCRKHELGHSEERAFPCEQCGKKFNRPMELKRHLVVHLDIFQFSCSFCNRKFKRKYDMTCHLKVHLEPTQLFQCLDCEKFFYSEENLSEHRLTHNDQTKGVCKCEFCKADIEIKFMKEHVCSEAEKESYLKVAHSVKEKNDNGGVETKKNSKTGGEKSKKKKKTSNVIDEKSLHLYNCTECDTVCKSKKDLNQHKLTHLDKSKIFQCEYCDIKFKIRNSLKKHQIVHTDPNNHNHVCDQCEISFQFKTDLEDHLPTHMVEEIYKCQLCNRLFKVKSIFERHHLLNHPNREKAMKMKCVCCQSVFDDKKDLELHWRKEHHVESV